ncbi:proteasome activator complex subunit 4-like [Achroia grisella]|uniref:proteasome activator complex subunit 4-like n=1 Tax=Achroia grisella TaxID=688607 RepID=UPI0027D2B442|nr:proteasome activator complex subunit 4-like [Achroia grisella]
MIQDDEGELMLTSPERVVALGFKPQKEILTNYLLPYVDELDEESQKFLEQVKTNLAKAIILREMKPACGVWSSRLMKYIRIYGLKFSKEDHIAFIKLAYELMLIPDLEPYKVHKFATMFIMLTKKRHLISPEELTLPWRPLFDLGKIFDKTFGLYHNLTDKPKVSESQESRIVELVRKFLSGRGLDDALELFGFGMAKEQFELPKSLEGSYLSMIVCARPYFEPEATKEILEEFLPQIRLWSSGSLLGQLVTFLPVAIPPDRAADGHLLWFDQLMTLWDTCYNSQCDIAELMTVFAGLTKRNPGAVDWTPYVAAMFTRFLHALNLPVSYKDMQFTRNHSLEMKQVARWIVWAINPDGVVLKHLRSFLAGVESYLHSANSGRWSYKLRDLLRKLAREFLNRVRREREKRFTESWENQTPESFKLRDEDITEFVNILLGPTVQAVYSRSGSLDIFMALQNLATLRPNIVVPPLLEKLRTSLTSLTEPHRVTAAMSAVASVARPMLRGRETGYPEGQTHVVPFLMAVLPGLDPNDIKKTLVTLHFILIFSWMVPIIDCSSAHEHWPDLTEEELLTCESTAQFEDFVLVFLDRLFIIIESSVLEHVRHDTKENEFGRSKTDAVVETSLSSAATAVLMQCSPKIFKEALRKFKAFATQTTFEITVSGSMVGVLLRVFARVNSEATLAAFVPDLCQELTTLLATDEAVRDEDPSRDVVYRLVLLMHAVECDGVVLLKYIDDIIPVLDRALKLYCQNALAKACDVLGHMLASLSNTYLYEWRSSPKDYSEAPEKWLPIREWGHGCSVKEANFKWHIPCAEEAACAQRLLDRYLKPELARLRQWLDGERPICRERRLRSFHIINASLSCSMFMPPPNEKPIALMESLVPATSMPFTNGIKHSVTLDGENMRVALINRMLDVQARMLAEKSDDTRSFEMLIQIWERVAVPAGLRATSGLEARLRSFAALERATDGRGGVATGAGSARLRMLLADGARLQHDARRDLPCDAGLPPAARTVLHALFDLSVYVYTSVRILAQIRMYWMLGHFPYSYRLLLPRVSRLLREEVGGEEAGEEGHARHKGVLCVLLGPRAGPLAAKHDWEVVRVLWPAILNAPLSEKPSIVRLEQLFIECLHRHFPAVNTRLTMSQAAIDSAKRLLTDAQLADPVFTEQLAGAVDRELANSNKTEKLYLELINELVDIAEAPNVVWRRLELVMHMLSFCPSIQIEYPTKAVKLMVNSLLHDNITVRRIAQRLVYYTLKQVKRPLKKILVDPYEVAGVPRPEKHVPGYRKDLEWVMWSEDRIPNNEEDWDRPWLKNSKHGFYSWPNKLEVTAPSSEQVRVFDLPLEETTETERFIMQFFNDDANIEKLVSFLTVEEKKGKDKFSGLRFSMFKMLFSHFGPSVTKKLVGAALERASSSQEAPQRFAAEIAAAALRAPRHWPFAPATALYEDVVRILTTGLTSVTVETMEDWATCVAMGVDRMDPLRGAAVVRGLLSLCAPAAPVAPATPAAPAAPEAPEDCEAAGPAAPASSAAPADTDTSFVICARLYALQSAIATLNWRVAPLASELLNRLQAANFTQHPYQNVREIVGSMLMTIFDLEVVFPGGKECSAPRLHDFLAAVKPRLAALYDENGDIVVKAATPIITGQCVPPEVNSCEPALETQEASVEVSVAQLSPEDHISEDTPQMSEESEGECARAGVSRASRPEPRAGARLRAALRLAAGCAPPPARRHADAVNLLTTVLRGCMGVVVRGVTGGGGGARSLQSLVRDACAVAARGPQLEELPRAAAAFLAALALHHHRAGPFDDALALLHTLADDRSWWARLSCLEFAQPLLFYGLPLLCEQAERAVSAEQFALKLMRDPRLEVRQSAAKLLTGLMHCRALPDEQQTLRTLTRNCRSNELVERHCGVLGLCSYLASRPYSLGPKLGDVLAELAKHTNAPDPIPATIRNSLAEFRRTHQDDWPKHREQLTEEELDLLADLTSPPSYCA